MYILCISYLCISYLLDFLCMYILLLDFYNTILYFKLLFYEITIFKINLSSLIEILYFKYFFKQLNANVLPDIIYSFMHKKRKSSVNSYAKVTKSFTLQKNIPVCTAIS